MATCVEDRSATAPPRPAPAAATQTVVGITHTLLTASNDAANRKVYTTATIAPAANALITVAVLGYNSSSTPPIPTLSGGGMASWDVVASITFDTGTLPRRRLTVFRALSATPTNGALTITSSKTLSNAQWIVSQWDGVDQSGVNGAGAIGQAGSTRGEAASGLTVPLIAFENPGNAAYGAFGVRSKVVSVTPGAGFMEISEQPSGESALGDLEAEWAVSLNTIAATWTNLNAGALGIEIKAAATGLDPVAAVDVTPAVTSVFVGATVQLTAIPKDASGNPLSGRGVTWATSDAGVATVDGKGLVAGTGPGAVTITATSEGKSGSAAVTVSLAPVASVDVTPAEGTVPVGGALQLRAIPRDAVGNALAGRVVTWVSVPDVVAGVSAQGLLTGRAEGSAILTATSEGIGGSSAVTVAAAPSLSAGLCLSQTGPVVTVSGVSTSPFSRTGLADNTKIDAATAQFLTSATTPVSVGGASNVCLHGGQTIGYLPPATDWNTMHSTYALEANGVPNFVLENVREFDFGDGINLLDSAAAGWTIRGTYFKYMRDDCVQNDWLRSGTIDGSFFDGCYVGVSSKPLSGVGDGSTHLVVVKNSLFRLQDMDQGYDEPGHGGFFKWSPTGPMVALHNNVYRLDSPSNVGTHSLGPPVGKLQDCANNVMIWLGSGPFPETLPSCYTLLTGAEGLQYWNNAVAQWNTNHPSALVDVGPPIVSLHTPSVPTTLGGTVTLTATAVDDHDVAGVQFRLNGQGVGPEVTAESPVTKFTVAWDSHGMPDGAYVLTANARDAAGNATTSAGIPVTILQVAAVAVSPSAVSLGVGATAQLTAIPQDAAGNPLSGRAVTWTSSDAAVASVTGSGLVTGVGIGSATITATSEGTSGTSAIEVTNVLPPPNQAPVPRPGGPYRSEGVVGLDGGASVDPESNTPLTYAWDFGDGTNGSGVAPIHTYGSDNVYTVTLIVTDALGAASAPATTTATIANLAPTVNAGPDVPVSPGAIFGLSASFSDPGANDGPWTYVIDWGDGTTETGNVATQGASIAAGHPYATTGQYVVQLTVTDKDGGSGSDALTVTVAEPVHASITTSLLTAGTNVVNQKLYTTASFAPAANTLVTVAVLGHNSSSSPPIPTLSGGGMPAWDVVATVTFDGATPLKRLTIFRAMSGLPGSGPLTITSSVTLSDLQWVVSQWDGVDRSGANGAGAIVQTGTVSGTAVSGLTVLLADFGHPNNVAYGAFAVAKNTAAVTPGAGFTEISEQPSGETTPADLEAEWALNLPAIVASWANLNAGALGVEIRARALP